MSFTQSGNDELRFVFLHAPYHGFGEEDDTAVGKALGRLSQLWPRFDSGQV